MARGLHRTSLNLHFTAHGKPSVDKWANFAVVNILRKFLPLKRILLSERERETRFQWILVSSYRHLSSPETFRLLTLHYIIYEANASYLFSINTHTIISPFGTVRTLYLCFLPSPRRFILSLLILVPYTALLEK